MMEELYKEYVISFFDRELMMHGDSPGAVRCSAEGQLLRFESLLDIDESIEGATVLDYGCGKGDLYQYLLDKGVSVRYTGFDINENLIAFARRKYPGADFRVFDIEQEHLEEKFDYIFLCSVFNLKLRGIDRTVKNVLTNLFPYCRRALAFNALSDEEPRKAVELSYLSTEEMAEFARKELSPHVSFAMERIPYDFTMFIRNSAP